MKQILFSAARAFLPVSDAYPRPKRFGLRTNSGRNARATAIVAIAIAATSAIAQTQPATTKATTRPRGDFRTLVVSPMAVPVPALKYPLRVAAADQIEGNAAPLYLQAFNEAASTPSLDAVDDAASDIADDADYLKWFADHGVTLDADVPPLLATATLRGDCDWALPVRYDNVRAVIRFLQPARATTNLLNAKFRLALAKGDVDRAIRLLRVQTVMADHLDAGNVFLVNSLVAVGIEAACMNMHERLVQRPDAPNLYWSLRQFHVPFANFRGSLECEQTLLLSAIPSLRKARGGEAITAADWTAYVNDLRTYQSSFAEPSTRPAKRADVGDAVGEGVAAMALNGLARPYYARTRHLTDAQVAKLDPRMLAAVYTFETYQQMSDSVYQWYSLPYPEMLPGLERASATIAAQPMLARTNPFAIAAPSLQRVGMNSARLDRTIAAITVVEALRAYAATHDNTLPPTLDAIVDTPAPMNPVTGKPFDYAVNGDAATIGDDGKLVDWPLRYEVRLRK